MRLLKVYDREKNVVENISKFQYSSLSRTWVNKVTIAQNPAYLKDSIVELYDHKELKIAWIVKGYSWNKEENIWVINIYPLLWDLYQDYISDPALTSPGDKHFYISDSIENVLDEIMDQYLLKVDFPILKKWNFASTWKNVTFTFIKNNLFEALAFLQNKMLAKWFYIDVDVDWSVNLVNITWTTDLKYLKDIQEIDFEESIVDNIKKIIFDNKKQAWDSERIYKEYINTQVTSWKALSIEDSRFLNEDSVDDYIQNIFDSEWSWIVEVNNIISKVDVPLYSKVNIFNWEKNFWEIYVVEKQFLSDWNYNLKVWNNLSFNVDKDSIASLENSVDETNNAIKNLDLVPEYIKETYIDSVEIKSPTISWNDWYFANIVKIWANWMIIDWVDESIRSKNYNLTNKTWVKLKSDWSFLLWKDLNNYLQFDWTTFNISWKIQASSGSSISFWDVTWSDKPANNATVWADWNTNLTWIPASAQASYITLTKITATTIESPIIAWNNWYFSSLVKVWASWININWVNKTISSSNFSSWNTGWIIKNDWSAEFSNIVARWTLKTALSWKRVEISSSTNRMTVFSDLWTEIMNIWYNVGTFNNLIWATVWYDWATGPLIWLKSSRAWNTAYFEWSSSSHPVVFAKTSSSSYIWFETTWRINSWWNISSWWNLSASWNISWSNLYCWVSWTTSYWEINNWRAYFANGIQTNWWDVRHFWTEKFYFRYNNTYFKVDNYWNLYWNDWNWEKQIAFV